MGTADSHVNDEAHVDRDIAPAGAVAIRRGPIGDIAVGAAGTGVVVTHYGDDSVSFLNPDTLAVEDTIEVPGEPFAAVVADDRAYVSTSSSSYDAVSVIDTNTRTVIATYPLAFGVTALAVSPDGKRVYAGRTGHDHVDVAVIDTTAERVGTIDLATGAGIGVDAIAIDPTGKRLYVATTDARGSQPRGGVFDDLEQFLVGQLVGRLDEGRTRAPLSGGPPYRGAHRHVADVSEPPVLLVSVGRNAGCHDARGRQRWAHRAHPPMLIPPSTVSTAPVM